MQIFSQPQRQTSVGAFAYGNRALAELQGLVFSETMIMTVLCMLMSTATFRFYPVFLTAFNQQRGKDEVLLGSHPQLLHIDIASFVLLRSLVNNVRCQNKFRCGDEI